MTHPGAEKDPPLPSGCPTKIYKSAGPLVSEHDRTLSTRAPGDVSLHNSSRVWLSCPFRPLQSCSSPSSPPNPVPAQRSAVRPISVSPQATLSPRVLPSAHAIDFDVPSLQSVRAHTEPVCPPAHAVRSQSPGLRTPMRC